MKRLSLAALAVLLAACGSDNPPGIQLFTAASPSIALGDSTELVIAADRGAILTIDQGIGDVTGKTSVAVSPTVTTTYTLKATALGMSTTSKTTVTVGHGAASQVTLTGLSSELAVDTVAPVTVTVRDRFGNAVTDYTGTLHFVLTDAAAPAIADVAFTAAMQGTTTVQVQFVTEGEQSLIATDTTRPSLTSSTITQVRAGSASAYSLSPLPASAIAGEPLALTITAVDRHGNVVKNYPGTAHLSSTDPTDRLPADGGFTGGVRTISLAFVTAGSHLATVSEVGGTITANTTSVDVVSGDAVDLLVSGASAIAGTAASTTVTAKDRFGNTVRSYTGTVVFSSSDAQAILPANYTFVTGDAGQHIFALTMKTAGQQIVTAADAAHSLSSMGTFAVAPANGTACNLIVLAKSAAQVGLRVTVKDAFDNVATAYTGTIALSSSDPSATFSAPATYTATDAGTRTFSGQVPTPGDQTITATDSANAISCRVNVTIVGTSFFAVAFTGPESWAGNASVAVIQAQDSIGNPITNYAGTIAFGSSDAAAIKPANVTLNGTEGGTASVNVTFNTMGIQTLTATDSVDAAKTGLGFQTVRGLVYTDPSSGGKARLIRNASSNASLVQIDLVSNTTLFNTSNTATGRNGVFAAGMNLPLDASKVGAGTPLLVAAPFGTTGTGVPNQQGILNLGAAPQAIGAALSISNNVLYSGVSQKRVSGATTLGDQQVRPFPGTASVLYYSIKLKLVAGASPGTVFDGQALAAGFHAAVRDRSGTDVFQNADFALGKLEVR